jgi:hypothetical protein
MNFPSMLYQPFLVQEALPTLQTQVEFAIMSRSEVLLQSFSVSEQFTAFRAREVERFIGLVDVAGMSLEEDGSAEGTTAVFAGWNGNSLG